MKKHLVIGILCSIGLQCFSQVGLTLNYKEVLDDEKLKSIKTMYYRSEDTTKSEGRVLFRLELDNEGKEIEKYVYTFWDAVSYNNTTTFKYNANGSLIEKTKIQKILNLGKRDEGYIAALGDDPINEKTFYTYDDIGRLKMEMNYTYGKETFDTNSDPSSTVEYIYDVDGQLITEIGRTPNGRVTYQNYKATYEYDEKGNMEKEKRVFLTSPAKTSKTKMFTYDVSGQLIEKKIEDSSNPRNNKHLKYEYDDEGNKVRELRFSANENEWTEIKSFSYDQDGNLVLGDQQTTFDYYDNGLVRRELWKSSKSDETVNFISVYEFY